MVSAAPAFDAGVAPPAGLGPALGEDFFARPVAQVAPELIGCTLLVRGVGGTIVETERYQQDDPASHSHRGPTPRARVMFGPPARLYVYRSYGLHWCVNLVAEPPGQGAAVLLRAIEPLHGLDEMRARRPGHADRLLCSGPGRLCAALGIDDTLNGARLDDGRVSVHAPAEPLEVVAGPRIGISRAQDRPWRYCARGSRFLSRPGPRA